MIPNREAIAPMNRTMIGAPSSITLLSTMNAAASEIVLARAIRIGQ
jgi:hypothetical protein